MEHTPDPKFRVKNSLDITIVEKQPPSACICFRWLLIFHHGKSPSNQRLEKIVFTFFKHLKQIQEEDFKKLILNQFLQRFIYVFPEDKIDFFPAWWHVLWRENTETWGRWTHFDHCSRNTYECSSILTLYFLTVAAWSLFISCFGFGELIISCKRADTRLRIFAVPQWPLVVQENSTTDPNQKNVVKIESIYKYTSSCPKKRLSSNPPFNPKRIYLHCFFQSPGYTFRFQQNLHGWAQVVSEPFVHGSTAKLHGV